MKRLQRLARATDYFYDFSIPDVDCSVVVDQDNAISALATASGDQLLISLPEESENGQTTDDYASRVTVAMFAIARINGPACTPKKAREAYSRLLGVAQAAVTRLSDDITGGGCSAVSGLRLIGLNVVPEYSIFGGWSGYSIEITLD